MQRTGRGKKDPIHLAVARRRIDKLYALSKEKVSEGDYELARRYTYLAKRIGMRYTVRVPRHLKQMTCESCMIPMVPGRTARVRMRNGRRILTCLKYGSIKRIPYRKTEHGKD